MKRAVFLLILIIPFIILSPSFAQSPAITNGLSYLSTTQNPDGSWYGAVTRGMFPTTVASIETLSLLGQGNTESYSNAVTWTQSQNLETTDFLSERIHALSTPGTDLDLALSYVDGVYTGAWCGYKDYEVNILDTALTISALKKINYPDLDTISSALFYLTNNQNADGGFGSYAGDDSSVYMTAVTLNALISYSDVFDLESEINKAVAYLLTKQNPDGGFGSGGVNPAPTSTTYETAMAFEALIASGADISVAAQPAIDYLLSSQLPDSSWNDDPYSTALALREITEEETTKDE